MPDIDAVRLENSATIDELDAIAAVLRSHGVDAEVRADWEKEPGTGNGAFYMVLVVLTVTLGPYLAGFLGKAGEDSWDAFRRFVDDLHGARDTSVIESGWVEFEDPDGTTLMISELPPAAIQKLSEVDWARHRGGQLMFRSALCVRDMRYA
jgi:hypothetical protein